MKRRLVSLILVFGFMFSLCCSTAMAEGSADSTESAVAQAGEQTFTSLADAFFSVQDGETISLLSDVVITDSASTIVVIGDITLDLNGHIITNDPDNSELVGCPLLSIAPTFGSLTIVDSDGGGAIKQTLTDEGSYAILNNGSLCIMSGTIYGADTAIRSQVTDSGGGTVIKGGTIQGGQTAISVGAGSLTVSGGVVESLDQSPAITTDNDGASVSVTISGGTIIGDVDENFYDPSYAKGDDQNENYYSNLSDFRKDGNYTAPVQAGKVFCGWYADANYSKYLTASEADQATGAYAKFVDENVLRIAWQITANTTADSETTNLRLLTSLDTNQYQKVGFIIQMNGKESVQTFSKAYHTICATENGEVKTYDPGIFSTASSLIVALRIDNIGNEYFDQEITVTPFWITPDGTQVTGAEKTFQVMDGIDLGSESE